MQSMIVTMMIMMIMIVAQYRRLSAAEWQYFGIPKQTEWFDFAKVDMQKYGMHLFKFLEHALYHFRIR